LGNRSDRRRAAGNPFAHAAREGGSDTAARGKSAWEIGEILHVSKRTVDEHVQTAVRKLSAANRTQAVAIAVLKQIIEADT
jgi:hypothetical protein